MSEELEKEKPLVKPKHRGSDGKGGVLRPFFSPPALLYVFLEFRSFDFPFFLCFKSLSSVFLKFLKFYSLVLQKQKKFTKKLKYFIHN